MKDTSSVIQTTVAAKELSDTWKRGDPYEQYIGRWSRGVAPLFLSWLGVAGGLRSACGGCGAGALCTSILSQCSPSFSGGRGLIREGFLEKAKEQFADRVVLHRGGATEIPLDDASVDATVSGLVLNFIPDGRAALAEMAHVTVSGGTVGAYVWDYAEGMELIRLFWDPAVELDPDAAMLDEEPVFRCAVQSRLLSSSRAPVFGKWR